jgi:hypothetical protein
MRRIVSSLDDLHARVDEIGAASRLQAHAHDAQRSALSTGHPLLSGSSSESAAPVVSSPPTIREEIWRVEEMVQRILAAIEVPDTKQGGAVASVVAPTATPTPATTTPTPALAAVEEPAQPRVEPVDQKRAETSAPDTKQHHQTLGELVADVRRIVSSLDDLHARVDEFSGKPAVERIVVTEPPSADMKALMAERDALQSKLQGANDAIEVRLC